MKNKIKSILALFLLLPCIFMFAGCFNNNSINLDISGEYTPVESSQFSEYTKNNSIEVGQYFKMKTIFKTDYSSIVDPNSPSYDPEMAALLSSNVVSTVEVNAHYAIDETGEISTCSASANAAGIKMNVYISNGMIYMDIDQLGKICMTIEDADVPEEPITPEEPNASDDASQITDISFMEEYKTLLNDENIANATLGYNVKITNEGKENETKTEKYKIEFSADDLKGTAYDSYVIYLVYKNNSLYGINLTYSANIASYDITIIMVDEAPTLPNDLDTYYQITNSDTGSL